MFSTLTASQIGIRVLREMPSGTENAAHAWLLRGGYLYQHAAGIYCFTPLMYRVEEKLSAIIATEITREGGSQVRLPILQSANLWKQSGRWDVYSRERLMFQLKDRRGREFGLSPTAEEAVCDLVKHIVASVSQLPLTLFQQNFKFRDELRPRSGLLRTREFIMMDAYSFDVDEAGLDESYKRMRRAYHAIFRSVGIEYITVDADSGAIGGATSEEFMSISEEGEDSILFNEGYAANLERAVSEPSEPVKVPDGDMKIVDTPGVNTIEKLADYLEVDMSATLKTMVFDLNYSDRSEQIMVLIRGDKSVNDIKLANYFGALDAKPSPVDTVERVMGTKPGYIGPIGHEANVICVADISLDGITSLISGCGQPDKHAVNVKPGRDFPMPEFVDLREAQAGETGPNGIALEQCRGIEIGHIFKLGDKYSKSLDAGVIDKSQAFRNFQMGCYGIGTTRVIAALVDQNCDDTAGIVWPLVVAPFHVHVIPLRTDLLDEAKKVVASLSNCGVESLLDDRGGSVGAMMKDSDILGLPLRIVLGRDFVDGKVEFLNRLTGEKGLIDTSAVAEKLEQIVADDNASSEARRSETIQG